VAQLKWAGFDALIVEGVASRPVYLWIKDGEVEIRDAYGLWYAWVGSRDRRARV